jgi:GR25 family glycosyltransferase involved in LPS biosynthesis
MRYSVWYVLLLCIFCLFITIYFTKTRETFTVQYDTVPGIDVIYYINLEHRTDRKESLLANLKEFGIPEHKIQRIDAVLNKQKGGLGCILSHKKTCETFLQSKYKTCLIFEDDFMFNVEKDIIRQRFTELEKIPYDLCMLSANDKAPTFKVCDSPYPSFKKVLDAQTASAYCLKKEFAPKLIENLNESYSLLSQNPTQDHLYMNDMYWKKLQPSSNWYITIPILGVQRTSYSDIENSLVNYGV